jgi:hypothetical protein
MVRKRKLTAKQRAFAETMAAGRMSQSDAYRHCYKAENMKPAVVRNEASKLMAHHDIAMMIETIRGRVETAAVSAAVSDRDRVLQKLREKLDSADTDANQLRAAELLGRSCALFTDVLDDKRKRTPEEIKQELQERLAMLADPADSEALH